MANPYVFNNITPPTYVYIQGDSTTVERLNFAIENTRYTQYALSQLGLTPVGQITATWTSPFILVVGANFIGIWGDFTDTANPVIRVKFGVGSVPIPDSITDGLALSLGGLS